LVAPSSRTQESKHSIVLSLLISKCRLSHHILPITGDSPDGFSILAHLQSWHLLAFSDINGIKQDIFLLCPIGIFLLLHQTVPDGGLCPSGALSSPNLQNPHVYIAKAYFRSTTPMS